MPCSPPLLQPKKTELTLALPKTSLPFWHSCNKTSRTVGCKIYSLPSFRHCLSPKCSRAAKNNQIKMNLSKSIKRFQRYQQELRKKIFKTGATFHDKERRNYRVSWVGKDTRTEQSTQISPTAQAVITTDLRNGLLLNKAEKKHLAHKKGNWDTYLRV